MTDKIVEQVTSITIYTPSGPQVMHFPTPCSLTLKIGSTRKWFSNIPLSSDTSIVPKEVVEVKPSCVDIAMSRTEDMENYGSPWPIYDLFKMLKKRHCIVINESISKYCVYGNLPKDPTDHEYYLLSHIHIERIHVKCCTYDNDQIMNLAFSEGGVIRALKEVEPTKHKIFETQYGELCVIASDNEIDLIGVVIILSSSLIFVVSLLYFCTLNLRPGLVLKEKVKIDSISKCDQDVESLLPKAKDAIPDPTLFFGDMMSTENVAKANYKPTSRCVDVAFEVGDKEEGFGTYRALKEVFRLAKDKKVLLIFTELGYYYWPDTLCRFEHPRYSVQITEFHATRLDSKEVDYGSSLICYKRIEYCSANFKKICESYKGYKECIGSSGFRICTAKMMKDYDLANMPRDIDLETYNTIIKNIDARLSSKLMLMFDNNLPSRLNHLKALIDTSSDKIKINGKDYEVVDIEGMFGVCLDKKVDMLCIAQGEVLLLDFTNDKSLLRFKRMEMQDLAENGKDIFDISAMKVTHQLFIENSYTVKGDSYLHTETHFRSISHFDISHRPKDDSMNFINRFTKLYEAAIPQDKKYFDNTCKDLSFDAVKKRLEDNMKTSKKHVDEGDKKIIDSMKDVLESCLMSNGPETALAFEEIVPRLKSMKSPEIKTALEYMEYCLSKVNIKDRIETSIRVPSVFKGPTEDKLFYMLDGMRPPTGAESKILPALDRKVLMLLTMNEVINRKEDEYFKVANTGEMFMMDPDEKKLVDANSEQKLGSLARDMFAFVKKTGKRSFLAVFNENEMHGNFHDLLLRKSKDTNTFGSKMNIHLTKKYSELEVNNLDFSTNLLNKDNRATGAPRTKGDFKSIGAIKVLTILNDANLTSGPMDMRLNSEGNVADYALTDASISASHDSSEAKSISSSAKIGSRGKEYYIGENNPFASITLIKKGADMPHLKTVWYETYYKDESGVLSVTPFRSIDRNKLVWNEKLEYTQYSLFDYAIENGADSLTAITDCLIGRINRDKVTVMMLKSRYLYMAVRGDRSRPSETLKKALDRDFRAIFKSKFENLFFCRMVKYFICGWCMNMSRYRVTDSDGTSRQLHRSIDVCLPNMALPVPNYEYHVSSFYVARAFNKFRTEKGPSDSENYMALLKELEIFEQVKKDRYSSITGLGGMEYLSDSDTLNSMSASIIENRDSIIESMVIMMSDGPQRYKQNFIFTHACLLSVKEDFKSGEEKMKKELFNTNVTDLFTLRGGMERGAFKPESQQVRAASSIYEHFSHEVADVDPNKSMIYKVQEAFDTKGVGLCSLYTLKAQQTREELVEYLARIISKDQDGDREITVMNAMMRIGCKFAEMVMEVGGKAVEENIMDSKNKEQLFRKAYDDVTSDTKIKDGGVNHDTNDQSRWGPNQLMNELAHLGVVVIEDKMIRDMFIDTMNLMSMKQNKWPEGLIRKFMNMVDRVMTVDQSQTSFGRAYTKWQKYNVGNETVANRMPMGMGQGILGTTTSILHAAVCRWQANFLKEIFGVKIIVYVTSDDSYVGLKYSGEARDMGFTQQLYVDFRSETLSLANIIRNKAKSFVSSRDAEVNSIFIIEGNMVAPVGKYRTALMDCGDGLNYYQDAMGALARGAQYIAKGGSIYGSYVMSAINVSMLLDQWRRFQFYEKHPQVVRNPVEFGGPPLIQPIVTMMLGPLSTSYLKSGFLGVDADIYARIMSNCMLKPVDTFSGEEMSRSLIDRSNMNFYLPESIEGVYNFAKAYKYTAAVEKRSSFSKLLFGNGEYPVDNTSMSYVETMNYVLNRFKTNQLSEGMSHDYLDRKYEPMYSRNRENIKISKESLIDRVLEFGREKISLDDLETKISENPISELELKKVYSSYLNDFGLEDRAIESLSMTFARSFNTAMEITMACDDTMTANVECKTDVRNSAKVMPPISELLVHPKDLKLAIINRFAGVNADKYNRIYGYKTLGLKQANMEIREALLRAESATHAIGKHVMKGTKIFNKIKPETANYTDMVRDLFKNNYMYSRSLNILFNTTIRHTESILAISSTMQDAATESYEHLKKFCHPGFNAIRCKYAALPYTTLDSELNHSSELFKRDNASVNKTISSIKDVDTYKTILAATRADVSVQSSTLINISAIKMVKSGYCGTTTSNFKVQGTVKWNAGRISGVGLIVTQKLLGASVRATTYKTNIYINYQGKAAVSLATDGIKSRTVRDNIEAYNRGNRGATSEDRVSLIPLEKAIVGKFCKFGDCYMIDLGLDLQIPVAKDYTVMNSAIVLLYDNDLSDQAEFLLDEADEENLNNMTVLSNYLARIEGSVLSEKDSISAIMTLTKLLSQVRRKDLKSVARDAIASFVADRTMGKEGYFKMKLSSVMPDEEDIVEDEDEEEDDIMSSFTAFLTTTGVINPLTGDESQPTSEEVRRALEGKMTQGLGKSFRDLMHSAVNKVLPRKDIDSAVQLFLSNKQRFSNNFLVWLLVDFLITA